MPLKSDPRRLPRRNHYQEGPDFLFVATQFGRPAAGAPPRDAAAAVRGREAVTAYYNYHRLHGERGWRTPAGRSWTGASGTPSPAGVADLLAGLLAA